MPATDDGVLFFLFFFPSLFPSKKFPLKFSKSTRELSERKRTKSDKFVRAYLSGKKSLKAGHGENHRYSSSPLVSASVSTSSSPSSRPLLPLFSFPRSTRTYSRAPGRDGGKDRGREGRLSVDEEEEKKRGMRWELGTRF